MPRNNQGRGRGLAPRVTGDWRQAVVGTACMAAMVGGGVAPAGAQEVALPFDGSASPGAIYLTDIGDGPSFIEGRFGQAILFGRGAVVAVPFDIDARRHPRLTVSLWLRAGADAATQAWLFGPGDGNNLPFLQIVGGRHVAVAGRKADGSGGRLQSDTSLPVGEWVPVAAVWDYQRRTIRLHVGSEVKVFDDLTMDVAGGQVRPPRPYVAPDARDPGDSQPWVFIGARNFRVGFPAWGYAIDDVQIFTRALDETEVAALAGAGGAVVSGPPTVGPSGAPGAGPGATCSAHAECSTGFYCAMDHTCHPDSHLPLEGLAMDTVAVATGLIPGPPTATSYGACTAADQCRVDGDACFDMALPDLGLEGSMCTRACSADSQCPASNGFAGACYAFSGAVALCHQRCDISADCATGSSCVPVTLPGGSLDAVCVPDAAGGPAPDAADPAPDLRELLERASAGGAACLPGSTLPQGSDR